LNLSIQAAQPILPGNYLSGPQSAFELKSIILHPFSSDAQEVKISPSLISIDNLNLITSIAFCNQSRIILSPKYYRFKPSYSSALLSSVLYRNCILRI
jgi:hypothetical protein